MRRYSYAKFGTFFGGHPVEWNICSMSLFNVLYRSAMSSAGKEKKSVEKFR